MVKKIHEEARHHILKKNKQYVERANKGRKKVTFEPGDWVWVHMKKERFSDQRKSKLSPQGIEPFQVIGKINDNAYKIDLPGFDSMTNSFEERGNDEDCGHDNEADAHKLGSRTREEGAEAQDLGGLHVPSGPITRAKAKQIQQAIESLLMGFLGKEESNSIGSPKAFIQLTCHEMLKIE
ncbi:hypothetical protein CRG98_042683 [Punica granatum]|uniref:Tf2-1-like SH3-like domain-containing protein n=1 Tax=Punica granatum TaxID=22663 RepID=A0A2I0I0C5_PUNGR|nr:hypothetical protein CRG98_042683 [Punica granatum]